MDKGLADMETGSEVYMSELLVSNNHYLYYLSNTTISFLFHFSDNVRYTFLLDYFS